MASEEHVMNVVTKVYDTIEAGENELVDDKSKFYYDCRMEFNNLPGIDKDKFWDIVERAKSEYAKPLTRRSYLLATLEADIKESAVAEVYQIDAEEPDEIRRLNGIIQGLRSEDTRRSISALKDCFDYLSADLQSEVELCWPGDLNEGA